MPVDLSKFDGMTPGPWRVSKFTHADELAGLPNTVYGPSSWGSDEPDEVVCWGFGAGKAPVHAVCANAAAIAAVPDLIAEVRELRAIVDKLPKTADGVAVVPGQTYVIETGKGVLFEQVLDIDAQGLVARTCYGPRPIEFWDDYEGASIVPAQVWSNTKAAEAARRNEENDE
jgi:hypothetical protein